MREQWSRRGFLRAGAAAGLLVVGGSTACSSHKTAPTSGHGGAPVTITHAFGETTIPEPPKRVVSAGFTEQDDLLALGVVPIAVTNWFGDQPSGVWPWAQPGFRSFASFWRKPSCCRGLGPRWRSFLRIGAATYF